MSEGNTKSGIDLRRDERIDFAEPMTIEFETAPVPGSGENISVQGVYFTTAAAIPVNVRIRDGSVVRGELVRAESMGDGRVGIAVRFSEPSAGLITD